MSKMNGIKSFAIDRAYDYIEHNPEQNAVKLLDMVDWFAGDGENSFPKQREAFRKALTDKESNWYQLIMHVLKDMDSGVVKKFFSNFILNANLVGRKRQEEIRQKYNCNAPWAILLDPTSACNLHCTGCWAGEYGHQLNLSFDEIDSIITQGKDLGTYFYIYTGGEPLIRKKDIIRLCEKHSDCIFLSFTNATLIDEDFADEMLRVKNFIPAISVEGDRKSHDSRRGEGSFDKVVAAMNLLKEKRLPSVSPAAIPVRISMRSAAKRISIRWWIGARCSSGISTTCRWATTLPPSFFRVQNSGSSCIIRSENSAEKRLSSLWIFKMTASM